jgi:DNA-binding CsgD family transcriptional regulator
MAATEFSMESFVGVEPLLAGLDGLAHGVAVLDASGRVRYANTAARSVMADTGWGGESPRVSAMAPASARLWSDALHRVCRRGLRELLQVPRGEGICYAALAPVKVCDDSFAFVTFGRNELCGPVELQMFAQRCGLTSTEGMVLRQLCRGLTAVEIAQAHGVATCTVLSQIAAIRNKTLFKSVRELLDSLSRMPPLMAAGMRQIQISAQPPSPHRPVAEAAFAG